MEPILRLLLCSLSFLFNIPDASRPRRGRRVADSTIPTSESVLEEWMVETDDPVLMADAIGKWASE